MGLQRFARIMLRIVAGAIALPLLFGIGPSDAATRHPYAPRPSSSLYRYEGIVYDRAFSVNAFRRFAQRPPERSRNERPASPGPAYAITNLAAVFTGYDGPLLGFPTAVNNGGLIAFYDECGCIGYPPTPGNAGIVTDDLGDELSELPSECCEAGESDAIPYALNAAGNATGVFGYTVGGTDSFSGNITWSFGGNTIYFDGADSGSATFALNDRNVAVGVDVGPKGVFAGAYSLAPDGLMRRILLLPPKNTSWTAVATGIDDAGEIVGYATFGYGNGRAVRFFRERLRASTSGRSARGKHVGASYQLAR